MKAISPGLGGAVSKCLACALALACAACGGGQVSMGGTEDDPGSNRLPDEAVVATHNDIPVMRYPGVTVVGRLNMQHVRGTKAKSLDREMAKRAAALGGTHIISGDAGSIEYDEAMLRDPAVKLPPPNLSDPQSLRDLSEQGKSYLILRVPPELWHKLPHELRPQASESARK